LHYSGLIPGTPSGKAAWRLKEGIVIKHVLINMTIIVFVAMVLLAHLHVHQATATAILAFLCGSGVVVIGALSAHTPTKDGTKPPK